MATSTPSAPHRVERVLAYMIAGVVVASLLCFIAIIISSAAGMTAADYGAGAWPAVTMLPLVGLPLGMILILVLMVVSARRRAREARDARR